MNWTTTAPFNKYKYIVYNKGDNEDYNKTNVLRSYNIKNQGKCDHTYLYHIVHNYHNLSEIVVFLPGCLDVYFKYCSKTTNDNYIIDLCSHINLKANDKKYVSIMEKSNKLCKTIMDKLVKLNLSDKLSEMEITDKFNLELFNLVVPFIKFNDINECLL